MDYVSSQKWEIFPKNPENSKKIPKMEIQSRKCKTKSNKFRKI
jgi:hypothetical protein